MDRRRSPLRPQPTEPAAAADRWQHGLALAALAIVLAAAAWPLVQPYQVAGHSAYVDITRAVAFHEAVSHGDATPRWIPDFYHRYGSPIFNFYAPLSYYVVEFFRYAGADTLWALKLAYLAFWLAAIIGMYVLAAATVSRHGAVAAAAAYGTAPYLLVDLYVRNGIAEFACFGWLPWVFWGLWRTAREEGRFAPLVAALTYAGLVFTHNITAMIVTPLLAVFVIFAAIDWRRALRAWGTLVLGVGLSAVFWLPALREMRHVHADASLTDNFFDYRQHFLAWWQLLVRKWGFGSSRAGFDDDLGFMFGELLWIGLAAGLCGVLLARVRSQWASWRPPLFFGLAGISCLALTLPLSGTVWGALPLMPFVQFPWRFLLPATVCGAAALAVLPLVARNQWRSAVAYGLAALAVAASWPFFQARYVFHDVEKNAFAFAEADLAGLASHAHHLQRPDLFLTIEKIRELGVTSTAGHDYLPIDCRQIPDRLPTAAAEPAGDRLRVLSSAWGQTTLTADVEAGVFQDVAFNHFYFPGWRAEVDGVLAPLRTEPQTGRMVVAVSPGRHTVDLRFGDTPTRLIGKTASGAALIVLLAWLYVVVRRGR